MYPEALAAFGGVRNPNLKNLNNSIGYAYMETGDTQKAEQYFQREITSNGNLESACGNLARLYYQQKNFASLNNLVLNERLRPYIPGSICRHVDLHNRRFGLYFVNVFTFDYLTLPGLIAAAFVLWVWFNYLRRLDVFEPEKLSWLLSALILAMAIALLCGFLYDVADFVFGLRLTGGIFDDLMYCIFGIGLIEESVKIIPFLILLKFSGQINESIDYILYAAVCALGFAFMENLIYFQEPGLTSIIGRTLWSATGHMTWSALAAYGLFYAKYKKHNRPAVLFFVLAFAAACLLHGLYDFFLLSNGLWQGMERVSLPVLLFSIIALSNMIKNALNHSEFNMEKQKKIEGLSKHLVYSLSAIVLVQYLLVGWKLGIDNANFQFYRAVVFNYIPLMIIFGCLGKIHVQKGHWIPLLEDRKKRAKANNPQ
jgi:RsiW-degrading membrane proteinase PrsW (M82 family)